MFFDWIGISIALAVSEMLLSHSSTSYTFFATHFPQLTSLAQLYPNVKNVHLKTVMNFVHPVYESSRNMMVSRGGDGAQNIQQPTTTLLH